MFCALTDTQTCMHANNIHADQWGYLRLCQLFYFTRWQSPSVYLFVPPEHFLLSLIFVVFLILMVLQVSLCCSYMGWCKKILGPLRVQPTPLLVPASNCCLYKRAFYIQWWGNINRNVNWKSEYAVQDQQQRGAELNASNLFQTVTLKACGYNPGQTFDTFMSWSQEMYCWQTAVSCKMLWLDSKKRNESSSLHTCRYKRYKQDTSFWFVSLFLTVFLLLVIWNHNSVVSVNVIVIHTEIKGHFNSKKWWRYQHWSLDFFCPVPCFWDRHWDLILLMWNSISNQILALLPSSCIERKDDTSTMSLLKPTPIFMFS